MQVIKGKQGISWFMQFDIMMRGKISALTGVDIALMLTESIMIQLRNSPHVLIDILWTVCEDQAEKLDIDKLTFFTKHIDVELFDAACDKLFDEAVDFIPDLKKKEKARAMLASMRRVSEQAEQLYLEEARQVNFQQVEADAVAAIQREIQAKRAARSRPPTSTNGLTNLPANSGSTPPV
jgi:hypothetical protein